MNLRGIVRVIEEYTAYNSSGFVTMVYYVGEVVAIKEIDKDNKIYLVTKGRTHGEDWVPERILSEY